MPAQQGVVVWPDGKVLSALGEEDALPFPDALFDRIVMVHALEAADGTRPLMRQIWRVLAPGGRLVIVAPNRNSLWAQVEVLAFRARPALHAAASWPVCSPTPCSCPSAGTARCCFRRCKSRRLVHSGTAWERIGRRLWPRLAGVHLVEASKTLYGAPNPVAAGRRRRALARATG